jgi:lysophospholipase L1-like esterase
MSAVSGADVVEVEIGANDVSYSDTCGTSVACYEPTLPQIRSNLAAIVERIRELAGGHDVLVVLLDYWSVWLGGKYAAARGSAYVSAAAAMTADVNTIIRNLANRTGSAYVDLRAAFKGDDYTGDETDYLADDGDHPNSDGHRLAADALTTVITRTLHL